MSEIEIDHCQQDLIKLVNSIVEKMADAVSNFIALVKKIVDDFVYKINSARRIKVIKETDNLVKKVKAKHRKK